MDTEIFGPWTNIGELSKAAREIYESIETQITESQEIEHTTEMLKGGKVLNYFFLF